MPISFIVCQFSDQSHFYQLQLECEMQCTFTCSTANFNGKAKTHRLVSKPYFSTSNYFNFRVQRQYNMVMGISEEKEEKEEKNEGEKEKGEVEEKEKVDDAVVSDLHRFAIVKHKSISAH